MRTPLRSKNPLPTATGTANANASALEIAEARAGSAPTRSMHSDARTGSCGSVSEMNTGSLQYARSCTDRHALWIPSPTSVADTPAVTAPSVISTSPRSSPFGLVAPAFSGSTTPGTGRPPQAAAASTTRRSVRDTTPILTGVTMARMTPRMPRRAPPVLALTLLAACGDGDGRGSGSDTQVSQSAGLSLSDSNPETGTGAATESTPTGGATDSADTSGASNDPSMDSAPKFDVNGAGTDANTTGEFGCENLECQIPDCPNGQTTTIKGVAYAPEGTLPLYNVVAYIPNAPLGPIPEGVYCDNCMNALSGDPLVADLTDTKGEFILSDVPAGAQVPLVITIGKWRRAVTLANVAPCVENVIPADLTRLPANKAEGNIPKIALATGGADPLECLLRKIGLDDSEFTPLDGGGRINLFKGDGGSGSYTGINNDAAFDSAQNLWNDALRLQQYDMVVLACEGGTNGGQKSAQARQNMVDYADKGGRLFLSHWHNIWIEEGAAPWPTVANFNHQDDLASPFTAKIDTSFPKGAALAEWLVNVQGSDMLGQIDITAGQNTIESVNDPSTRWIYGESPTSIQYFTFNTPVGAPEDMQCGRVVDTDIHVSNGDDVGQAFPSGCTTQGLTPQEKVLMFMLFELSSCVIPDDDPPVIPG